MATFIFVFSYGVYFVLSMIYLNPYLFIIYLLASYPLALITVVLFYFLNFPLVLLLRPTHPYKTYLMRSLAYFLCKWILNLKVEVEGLENIPKSGRLVAYANHKSYTDAFAIIQFFPRSITLTPKKSVFKIPFIRHWLKAYNVFAINRNNPRETLKDMAQAIETVKYGQVILFFPEGSIKDRLATKVVNAKAGSFRLVKEAEADLLPIGLFGNDLARKRWPRRTVRKIVVHPPISYEEFKDLNTKEIAQVFMDTINEKM